MLVFLFIFGVMGIYLCTISKCRFNKLVWLFHTHIGMVEIELIICSIIGLDFKFCYNIYCLILLSLFHAYFSIILNINPFFALSLFLILGFLTVELKEKLCFFSFYWIASFWIMCAIILVCSLNICFWDVLYWQVHYLIFLSLLCAIKFLERLAIDWVMIVWIFTQKFTFPCNLYIKCYCIFI